jgi:hypothetical protein
LSHCGKTSPDYRHLILARNSSSVRGYQASYISSCIVSSRLNYKEGDSIIKILIETSNNSREEIDIRTNIDIGVEIGVDIVIDIVIELEGYRVSSRVYLKISINN